MTKMIFLHIPKSGGMTLWRLINNNYHDNEVLFIDSFDYEGSFEKLFSIVRNNPDQLKLIGGHIGYGLHKKLPGDSEYITVLRNPVERIISQYHYITRTPQHYLYNQVVSKRMSLLDYVSSDLTREISNDQTRMIAGASQDLGIGDNSQYYLELAKKNLQEHFRVAGLLERFDEAVAMFMLELGWENLEFTKQNVTSYSAQPVVKNGVIEVIRERNLLDTQLYEYAEKIFEEKIKLHGQPFEDQLRKVYAQKS